MLVSGKTRQTHPTLGIIKNIRLKIFGTCKVGLTKEKGWKGALPLYAFKCQTHGIVYNTPQGHYHRLICPECIKQKKEKMLEEQELFQLVDDFELVESQQNQ